MLKEIHLAAARQIAIGAGLRRRGMGIAMALEREIFVNPTSSKSAKTG